MLRVLVVSTSGIKSDGITAWISQVASVIDPCKVQFGTVAWEGADSAVVRAVDSCGVAVHVLPNRQRRPSAYRRALLRLMVNGHFDVVHVCGSSGLMALEP